MNLNSWPSQSLVPLVLQRQAVSGYSVNTGFVPQTAKYNKSIFVILFSFSILPV